MHLKMPSAKQRPFCLGLNVLRSTSIQQGTISNVDVHTKFDNLLNILGAQGSKDTHGIVVI